jgi:hypothetical protein
MKFNQLPMTDKATAVAEFGFYLESIQDLNFCFHLYSLNHHFVEIRYNTYARRIDSILLLSYIEVDKYLSKYEIAIK